MTIDVFLVCHQGLFEVQVRGTLWTRDDATEIGRIEPAVVPTVIDARQSLSVRHVAGVIAD